MKEKTPNIEAGVLPKDFGKVLPNLSRYERVEKIELPKSWLYSENRLRMEKIVNVEDEDGNLIGTTVAAIVPHDIKEFIYNLISQERKNSVEEFAKWYDLEVFPEKGYAEYKAEEYLK